MYQIINLHEYSAFILFLVIVFIVWLVSKYEPKMSLKIAELDILQQVQRLEADFENARDLAQLDRLEGFIEILTANAKKRILDPTKYNKRLYTAYWNKHWSLVNEDYQGLPQNLIPFLTLK